MGTYYTNGNYCQFAGITSASSVYGFEQWGSGSWTVGHTGASAFGVDSAWVCQVDDGQGKGAVDHALLAQMENIGFYQYHYDIFQIYKESELVYHPINCLDKQPQVTDTQRATLIDWLFGINRMYEFGQETIFLTVNFLDRFLSTTPIATDCLQLLGVTAFFLASKKMVVNHPEVSSLLYLCGNSYSKFHILQMERMLLKQLGYRLNVITSLFFLEFFFSDLFSGGAISCCGKFMRALSRHILESTLKEYKMARFAPSLVALSVTNMTVDYIGSQHCSCKGGYALLPSFPYGYTTQQVNCCAMEIANLESTKLAFKYVECRDYNFLMPFLF